MRKISSTWLDGQEIRKDQGGMGRALTGPAFGALVAKIAAVEVVCKNGHQTTVLEAPDSGRCATCKAKLALKDSKLAVKDEDTEDDEMPDDEAKARGIAARKSEGERHGGMIDGRRIYSERKSSRANIDSPRSPYVRD